MSDEHCRKGGEKKTLDQACRCRAQPDHAWPERLLKTGEETARNEKGPTLDVDGAHEALSTAAASTHQPAEFPSADGTVPGTKNAAMPSCESATAAAFRPDMNESSAVEERTTRTRRFARFAAMVMAQRDTEIAPAMGQSIVSSAPHTDAGPGRDDRGNPRSCQARVNRSLAGDSTGAQTIGVAYTLISAFCTPRCGTARNSRFCCPTNKDVRAPAAVAI